MKYDFLSMKEPSFAPSGRGFKESLHGWIIYDCIYIPRTEPWDWHRYIYLALDPKAMKNEGLTPQIMGYKP